jgi:hypothetical protein
MPQSPTLVYDLVTGVPVWMASVDVAESVNLGDVSLIPVEGLEPTADQIADALARFRGVNVPI